VSQAQPRRSIAPDLWVGGVAAAIGLGAGVYDRHGHSGIVFGSLAYVLLCYVYPLPAGLFEWPQGWCIDVVRNAVDLLDFINLVFTIFS
jgi:hypothetical protein